MNDLQQARNDAHRFDANDKIRQAQAMMQLDVSREFGGSLERTAQAVKAKQREQVQAQTNANRARKVFHHRLLLKHEVVYRHHSLLRRTLIAVNANTDCGKFLHHLF